MTRLAQWTVETLSALGAFYPVGSIEVATTDERWAELDRRWARARGFGLDARLLDPAQVAELVPLIDPATILGGLHVADDGIAKAVRAAEALCSATRDRGVRRLRGDGSRRSRAAGSSACRPRSARSAPSTSSSPPASGAAQVAQLAPGLNVPLVPVEHQLAYTAPLPELAGETREVVHPILRHQDHAMYFRQVADALRDRQLPPRAAPGRSRAPGRAGLHRPRTSPRRARRRAGCCRRCATSS